MYTGLFIGLTVVALFLKGTEKESKVSSDNEARELRNAVQWEMNRLNDSIKYGRDR